jgi:DNA-binding response OmpR family regulator
MPQTDRRTRQRILCIEDDRESARLIAEELSDCGFDVDIAYNGHEGIAAIEKGRPDLVLCDICMPGISGFEVLRRLKELRPRFGKPHFVFLTALTEVGNRLKARQFGADNYIIKPIDFDVLAEIITARLATESNAAVGPMDVIGTTDLCMSLGEYERAPR